MFDVYLTKALEEGAKIESEEEKTEMVHFLNNPEIFPEVYFEKFKELDSMTDEQIFYELQDCLPYMLRDTKDNNPQTIRYFGDTRVLKALFNLSSRMKFSNENICELNRIFSMYRQIPEQNQSQEILNFMYNISKQMVKGYIKDITTMTGISDKHALDIATSVLTGSYDLENVINMNISILNIKKELLTQQNIIFIYETFNEILSMSDLLLSVMVVGFYPQAIFNKEYLDKFDIITKAVLCMLDQQEYNDIYLVLKQYNSSLYNNGLRPKGSMWDLGRYERVAYVAGRLYQYENIAIY